MKLLYKKLITGDFFQSIALRRNPKSVKAILRKWRYNAIEIHILIERKTLAESVYHETKQIIRLEG